MKDQRYLISQAFSLVISVVLVLVFFILLVAGMTTGQNYFITDLILIIIAIVLLAIFGVMNQIKLNLMGGRKR